MHSAISNSPITGSNLPWSNIICGVYGMLVDVGQTCWRSSLNFISGLVGILFLGVLTVRSAISIKQLGFAYVIIWMLSRKYRCSMRAFAAMSVCALFQSARSSQASRQSSQTSCVTSIGSSHSLFLSLCCAVGNSFKTVR